MKNHIVYFTLKLIWALSTLWSIFSATRKISSSFMVVYNLIGKLNLFFPLKNRKIKLIKGKIYWNLYNPPVLSQAYNSYIKRISKHVLLGENHGLNTLIVAITKKCSLNCEHCFEWDAINKKEIQKPENWADIIRKNSASGVCQVMLSGGEPLQAMYTILDILQKSDTENINFWVITSGINLTLDKAFILKENGLHGVLVSLDHHEESHHDHFRGRKGSWAWAIAAVQNARNVGLLTGFALCATEEYATENNLMAYADLAYRNNVTFIQILEPKPLGKWQGQSVQLTKNATITLEAFCYKMNYQLKYNKYPMVTYVEAFQRRNGCYGNGRQFLYIDTDGNTYACPFCKSETSLNGCERYSESAAWIF